MEEIRWNVKYEEMPKCVSYNRKPILIEPDPFYLFLSFFVNNSEKPVYLIILLL
jgi:hypothetical protein